MKQFFSHLSILVLFALGSCGSATFSMAEDKPPKLPFIIRPACPWEGCSFGKWVLKEPAKIYSLPSADAPVIGTLSAHQGVESITGEWHTLRYGEVKITKSTAIYECSREKLNVVPGQILYHIEELGENCYSVWFQGKIYVIDRWWNSPDYQYDNPWGVEIVSRISHWWVHVRRSSTGIQGWIMDPKTEGGWYKVPPIEQLESWINDLGLMIFQGSDYDEAAIWLKDFEKEFPPAVWDSISAKHKTALRRLRLRITQRPTSPGN